MSAARRKGRWVGGHPVLGYDLKPEARGLAINPEEAERVREIFQLYRELGSLLPVVQELYRRDWRLKQWINRAGNRKGGGPFTRNTLHVLLTNPVYAGQVRHRGKLYPGEHEAIVDRAVWNQAQQQLARHGNTALRKANRFGALLGNLVHCATCDAGMTHTSVRKKQTVYRYYACVRARSHGASACRTRSVSAPALEQAVVAQLRQLDLQPDQWELLSSAERAKAILQLVERVSFDGPSQTVRLQLRTTVPNPHDD